MARIPAEDIGTLITNPCCKLNNNNNNNRLNAASWATHLISHAPNFAVSKCASGL